MALGSAPDTDSNEYQGYLWREAGNWRVGLTTLPPSCANYVETLGASRNPKGLSTPVQGLPYMFIESAGGMTVNGLQC